MQLTAGKFPAINTTVNVKVQYDIFYIGGEGLSVAHSSAQSYIVFCITAGYG